MLYFIPTPIGNLNDISLRALELLKTCQILFCEDTRVSKSLIALLNERFNTGIKIRTFIPLHSHNEKEVLQNIDLTLFEQNLAYLSDAGMPGISDPGRALVEFCFENNLDFEVLPGANAALVALVSSGFCVKEFIFLGFLANKSFQRQKDIEKLLSNPYPSVVYESSKRILNLIEQIVQTDKDREIFAIKEISKKFQTKFKAKASDLLKLLANANLSGEWTLVIKETQTEFNNNSLCEEDILKLDLPLKTKCKLLAKMNGKNPKELYQKLLLRQN